MPSSDHKMIAIDLNAAISRQVSAWLQRRCPQGGAKRIARDFSASPHTVRRWMKGCLPDNRTLVEMARRWGDRFVQFIYAPATGSDLDGVLDREIHELRERLAWLEADLAKSRTDQIRRADGPHPRSDSQLAQQMASGPRREVAGSVAPVDGREG